jgi:diacylglycerol kinase (ATP)
MIFSVKGPGLFGCDARPDAATCPPGTSHRRDDALSTSINPAYLTPVAGLILNPAAGKGAARRRLQEIMQTFAAFGIRDVRQTRERGDEERVTLEAIKAGWKTIAVVGGDGTCGHIADALVKSGADCALAVVPAGTGNDFAKTLGVAKYTPDQIANLIVAGASTRIDVGRVDGRHFINSCGFGFDASVLEATARVKFLKGDALYIYSALAQLFTYEGIPIAIEATPAEPEVLMLTVSIGRFLGGAFRIAPAASVTDGELDICVVRNANVAQRVRLFAAAIRGTHVNLPAVRTFRTRRISLRFSSPAAMELDGELRHAQSNDVTIECIPRALKVVAAANANL